jgi:dephospho-CoA kinase
VSDAITQKLRLKPVVGLTGGIGSGKSAAAAAFALLGIPVVDVDLISHQLTAVGGMAIALIVARFGSSMVTSEGALDRAAMRQKVFSDPTAKQALESILHPLIREESQRQLLEAVGANADASYAILMVPLLVESGTYRERVDRVVVVDCPVETQVLRVIERSGLSRAEVLRIIATQATREQRLAAADDVINNDGTLEHLMHQVQTLDAAYRANRGCFSSKD